ncbi:hypothetical protein BCR33DRAFT_711015 [Rhizoclosmatium globosum]|uniref:HTH TFE/IIEalpha-type domain-containing protein n=1 Tax=Rhizoclosmatium globosum TaxID=329046 RepID=A0A1Y2D2V2_9FUNG|nr:hypothetical protein BCR33DRAFT_711015 [Rhizoclosmatium globosum]|eukprot:ORY53623.1 hypothetical protein BCR33DRAFT_711015 [Rhizoclosmatium globosum]
MDSKEKRPVRDILTEIVMRVGRSYYKEHFIIILDLLALKGAIKEEDMAQSLRLSPGDTRKLCKKLEYDKLVKSKSTVIEVRHYKHTKKTTKTYYYIDYKSLLNVVRYKMYKIQEVIRKEIDEHNNNLAYQCSKCSSKFDPFQAMSLPRTADGMFVCEYCPDIILEQEKGTDFENDLSTRFNMERGPILKLIQLADQEAIPEFVPPSEKDLVTTNVRSTVGDMLLPNQVVLELDGFDDAAKEEFVEDATPSGMYDDEGFPIDDKNALVEDYYKSLLKAGDTKPISDVPPQPTGYSFSMGGPSYTSYGGNVAISSGVIGNGNDLKRGLEDSNGGDIKRPKAIPTSSLAAPPPPAADVDDDLEDEEFFDL